MPHLETARLTIAPFTLDLLRAARRDPALVGQRLRLRVPASWPGPDIAAALPTFIRQLEPDPAQDDWSVHLVSHTATRTLIGFAGCNNGPPDATGTVEIGYDVLPAYQRHGYATEATSAIMAWFFAQLQVRRIIADCDVDNIASRRVLERCGLRQQAPTDDRLNWALSREE
jgi:ribosomal-protein-alanine N-acetyltransferase